MFTFVMLIYDKTIFYSMNKTRGFYKPFLIINYYNKTNILLSFYHLSLRNYKTYNILSIYQAN